MNDNYGGLAALFQCLTLIVWTLYLQLFLSSMRHRTRPKILINRGAGRSLESRCIITNMSAEPIYVEAVVAALGLGEEEDGFGVVCTLSNLDLDRSKDIDPRSTWYQGPLQGAEYLDVGSFRTIVERAFNSGSRIKSSADAGEQDVARLRVTVLASYTADSRTVAAERIFDIIDDGPSGHLKPRSLVTRQITSGRERRKIEKLLSPD